MMVDFGAVKSKIVAEIDERFDHATVVGENDSKLLEFLSTEGSKWTKVPGDPTAEVMATEIRLMVKELLKTAIPAMMNAGIRITLYETPTCKVTVGEEE